MKRTTIFVPESLERDLQLYAKRERKPTAAIVREAIAAYIARPDAARALPSFTGAFDSGHTDTAERHEELLFERLMPHGSQAPSSNPARTRRRRATSRRSRGR
jgi:hypothetical protein